MRAANRWLKRQGFDALADLNSPKNGKLGSNAVLFGGCYDYLDVDAFLELLAEQVWKHPEDVQVLFWDDNASKCVLLTLRRTVAKRKKALPKTRQNRKSASPERRGRG